MQKDKIKHFLNVFEHLYILLYLESSGHVQSVGVKVKEYGGSCRRCEKSAGHPR